MGRVRRGSKKWGALIYRKSWKLYLNVQNNSPRKEATSIPATFLRVTVAL
jgi:hypothetical protein